MNNGISAAELGRHRAAMTAKKLSRFYLWTFGGTAALAAAGSVIGSHLIYNATSSMPLGLYWVTPATTAIHREDLIAFHIPPSVQRLVHERAYLPDGAVLLKPVVATQGDDVCTRGGVLRVNGAALGNVLGADSAGRPLPHEEICEPLPVGEVFVASTHPQSFDSRTFGLIPVDAIRGTVVPLWTY